VRVGREAVDGPGANFASQANNVRSNLGQAVDLRFGRSRPRRCAPLVLRCCERPQSAIVTYHHIPPGRSMAQVGHARRSQPCDRADQWGVLVREIPGLAGWASQLHLHRGIGVPCGPRLATSLPMRAWRPGGRGRQVKWADGNSHPPLVPMRPDLAQVEKICPCSCATVVLSNVILVPSCSVMLVLPPLVVAPARAAFAAEPGPPPTSAS
jgi:hypothetical protein